MRIRIKRQKRGGTSYWQEFDLEVEGRQNVADLIDHLNRREQLTDVEGRPARRIAWDCSCMQKVCGACAMVIDGVPALACATYVNAASGTGVVIEPLSKFPVIEDLRVDRSVIFDRQIQAELYLGVRATPDPKEFAAQYDASKCLKCGLCLEVCPNYVGSERCFGGAVFATEAYLLASSTANRKASIRKQYNVHFAAGCSKSLSCRAVCPVGLETLSSIGYMNRSPLVNQRLFEGFAGRGHRGFGGIGEQKRPNA